MPRLAAVALAAVLTLGSCETGTSVPQYTGVRTAFAKLHDREGRAVGYLDLSQVQGAVEVALHLISLPPGRYQLDFHQRGECDARDHEAFRSAGAALRGEHGARAGSAVDVGQDGSAGGRFTATGIALAHGAVSLFDSNGSAAVLVRGDSARVACGVVRP